MSMIIFASVRVLCVSLSLSSVLHIDAEAVSKSSKHKRIR